MKNNSLATLLVGLLTIGVLAVAGLSFTFVRSVRKMQNLQAQAAAINQNRIVIQQLLTRSAEYAASKTNAAMIKILKDIGIEIKSGGGGPNPKLNSK
jgi:hypothetical protein